MTIERIAELRERAAWVRANKYSAMTIDLDIVDALLAECERTYTSELPKESGWYRRRDKWGNEEVLFLDEQGLIFAESLVRAMPSEGIEWSGPLTPPAGAQP